MSHFSTARVTHVSHLGVLVGGRWGGKKGKMLRCTVPGVADPILCCELEARKLCRQVVLQICHPVLQICHPVL
jgi:hypothetical protein